MTATQPAAAALPLTVMVIAPAAVAAPPHPDAELLALGAAMRDTNEALCEIPEGADPDNVLYNALCDRLYKIEDRIAELEPQTMAGMAVKLRLLWHWFNDNRAEHRYGAQPDSSDRTKTFWAIVRQAEAMGGVAAP